MNTKRLREEGIRLGPWHLDVQVTPELSTSAFVDVPDGTYPPEIGLPKFVPKLGDRWKDKMESLYPGGFAGRTFLDCACNCGGYSFWARELGASRTYGFDVREHWVRQAEFLREHRTVAPVDNMEFGLSNLYDLPDSGLDQFDVTLFSGIFYHLPDPVTGLKIACDQTRELILLNTATMTYAPEGEMPDGYLRLKHEGVTEVMSGIYGPSWYPTGPGVLMRLLTWCGFPESRIVWWKKDTGQGIGRIDMYAARDASTFESWDLATAGRYPHYS